MEDIVYLAFVPVAQLIVEDLLLLLLESLAKTQPAGSDSARLIAHTALVGKLLGNVVVRIAHLLELDNTSVIIVIIGGNGLRSSGFATRDPDVTLVPVVRRAGLLAVLLGDVSVHGVRI